MRRLMVFYLPNALLCGVMAKIKECPPYTKGLDIIFLHETIDGEKTKKSSHGPANRSYSSGLAAYPPGQEP